MYGKPHDPRIVAPGDHPPNGERHGIWRVLLASMILAVIGLATVWLVV